MSLISSVLVGAREFNNDLNEGSFQVRYYRIEKDASEADCGRFYGVRMTKIPADASAEEDSFEAFLSTDREQAGKILDGLIEGSVTPLCAPEAIDYLYDKTL